MGCVWCWCPTSEQGCIWLCGTTSAFAEIPGVCEHLQGMEIDNFYHFLFYKYVSKLMLSKQLSSRRFQEEEEERSDRWSVFLEQQVESAETRANGIVVEEERGGSNVEGESFSEENGASSVSRYDSLDASSLEREAETKDTKTHCIQIWARIRPSLRAIEHMMSTRVKRKNKVFGGEHDAGRKTSQLDPVEETRHSKTSEEDSEDEFYDVEKTDPVHEPPSDGVSADHSTSLEPYFPWKEELECLVHGGVPMALRGEVPSS